MPKILERAQLLRIVAYLRERGDRGASIAELHDHCGISGHIALRALIVAGYTVRSRFEERAAFNTRIYRYSLQ